MVQIRPTDDERVSVGSNPAEVFKEPVFTLSADKT